MSDGDWKVGEAPCPKCEAREAYRVVTCENCHYEREESHQPDLYDPARSNWTLHSTPTVVMWCYAEPTRAQVHPARPACRHFRPRAA